ncbi:MAG: hypothetical protein QOJ99_2138, partial [Bryobacterales bacterium]|nr:hypothetical protein [Bryobacterales bacterium]
PGATTVSVTSTAGPYSGTVAGNGSTVVAGTPNTATNSVFVPFALFSLYQNPPTGVSLSFKTKLSGAMYSGVDDTGEGDLSFTGTSIAGGTTTINYTYDAVTTPEPTMFGALAIGMAGLGIVARRRSLKA